MRLTIVEGLCYTHPQFPELVAGHPVMMTVWRKCLKLAGAQGAVMAPLLVDDRENGSELVHQTPDELIRTTTGKGFADLPWLGKSISEAELQGRYGEIGCVKLDAIYHLQVLGPLGIADQHWRWVVVHPLSFREQQSSMLVELWDRSAEDIDFRVLAGKLGEKKDVLRVKSRQAFLDRFVHHWVNDDGGIEAVTHPIYRSSRVIHEPIHS